MPTKAKPKTKKQVAKYRPPLLHPSTWLIVLLATAFIAVLCVATLSIRGLEKQSQLDSARLAVFSDLAESYIREQDLTDNGISEVYQMTGYGISDEDGVFYITFDFADPATTTITYADDGAMSLEGARHGIMYFWPSETSDTGYGHAYSYHDDDYHPDGTYVRLSI